MVLINRLLGRRKPIGKVQILSPQCNPMATVIAARLQPEPGGLLLVSPLISSEQKFRSRLPSNKNQTIDTEHLFDYNAASKGVRCVTKQVASEPAVSVKPVIARSGAGGAGKAGQRDVRRQDACTEGVAALGLCAPKSKQEGK